MPHHVRILPAAALAVLALAAALASALPAHAVDVADRRWSDDAPTWNGAGGGWNGASWREGNGGWRNGSGWTSPEANVQVRHLAIDRSAISPDGDGEGDAAFVTFSLAGTSAPVRVEVLDATGAAVRVLGEQRATRTPASFGWDGTTDADVPVPDGAYRVRLARLATPTLSTSPSEADADDRDALALDVVVDTAAPSISAKRPTLAQLQALARRAATLRDARRRWAQRATRGHGNKHGQHKGRDGDRDESRGPGNGGGNGLALGHRERDWVRLWESQQLRLPVTFATGEDGDVSITSKVGGASSTMTTWRAAGRSTVDVVLPTYVAGARAELTFAARDDAGNGHRHTVVVTLPAMPAPAPVRRSADGDDKRPAASTPAPVTNVPTAGGGPLPDWLDPIMLRATYGAGVPQSWARSAALSKLLLRESSYRPTAQNPTSTAYGLFQFLNQTWATVGCTKTSDAHQQSVCGLRYIQRRYGTPEKAWAFWQAHHWY